MPSIMPNHLSNYKKEVKEHLCYTKHLDNFQIKRTDLNSVKISSSLKLSPKLLRLLSFDTHDVIIQACLIVLFIQGMHSFKC